MLNFFLSLYRAWASHVCPKRSVKHGNFFHLMELKVYQGFSLTNCDLTFVRYHWVNCMTWWVTGDRYQLLLICASRRHRKHRRRLIRQRYDQAAICPIIKLRSFLERITQRSRSHTEFAITLMSYPIAWIISVLSAIITRHTSRPASVSINEWYALFVLSRSLTVQFESFCYPFNISPFEDETFLLPAQ
jgi:hypothetical protein